MNTVTLASRYIADSRKPLPFRSDLIRFIRHCLPAIEQQVAAEVDRLAKLQSEAIWQTSPPPKDRSIFIVAVLNPGTDWSEKVSCEASWNEEQGEWLFTNGCPIRQTDLCILVISHWANLPTTNL